MGNFLELFCYEEIREYDIPDHIFTIPETRLVVSDKSTMTDREPQCNDVRIQDAWIV